jgi:hexosaminidase
VVEPVTRAKAGWARLAVLAMTLLAPVGGLTACGAASSPVSPGVVPMADVVPAPVSEHPDPSADFHLDAATVIASPGGAQASPTASWLAALLRHGTGYALPIVSPGSHDHDVIALEVDGADPGIGDEGYLLTVSPQEVLIRANAGAGLFHGAETLRQLLPARIETAHAAGPWGVEGGRVTDYPRYPYRGAMLDVARHFFSVSEVERYIDEIAMYKIDYLHLHLSDDQGWRIAIPQYPQLTAVGGSTEVGGGTGGYYTVAEYQQIVAYAQSRYVTVIPEIDSPGHVNAALASLPQLTCDGQSPPLYTGIDTGFSALCLSNPFTYQLLGQVFADLAAITPGPYIDIGGDEASTISAPDYATFMARVAQMVVQDGKTPIGWSEISAASLPAGSLAEYWDYTDRGVSLGAAAAQGVRVVLAPADHAYLDQKYDPSTTLGLDWAGPVSVEQAYTWDPASYSPALPAADVEGVEAPLWSETLTTMADIEQMAWPRLAGIAEIGWSPESAHAWTAYRLRLAAQGARWQALGIDFHRSPEVPWS